MKTALTLTLLTSFFSFSQIFDVRVEILFDYPDDLDHLYIDTISNPYNVWQIGKPAKTNFIGGYAGSDITIVTDTLNPYPVNDTSSFIVWSEFGNVGYNGDHTALHAKYKVNSDSLNDFGKIEFSPDKGLTWVLISDDTLEYLDGSEIKHWSYYINNCNLTGNIYSGWASFYINLLGIQTVFDLNIGDTLLYRFTYISDASFDNLDGLEFDEITVEEAWYIGIDENPHSNFEIFPNPVDDQFRIVSSENRSSISQISICDVTGNLVSLIPVANSDDILVYCGDLVPGVYFWNLFSMDGVFIDAGRFVKK